MIQKLPNGANPKNKDQAVFIALYSFIPVFRDYPDAHPDYRERLIPVVAMIDRWDGLKGFPGGNVDDGESLKSALVRELDEEIGLSLNEEDVLDENLISSFDIGTKVVHLFAKNVSGDDLRSISSKVSSAQHFLSEICGVSLVHFQNYPGRPSLDNLMRSSLVPSVREQILDLIEILNL